MADTDKTTTKRQPPPNPPSPRALATAAADARRRRTEVLKEVSNGDLDAESLIFLASVDKAVSRIRIKRAIAALPGWGDKSADDACRWARIGIDRHLSYLVSDAHPDRAERLLRVLALGPGHRPEITDGWPMFRRLSWLETEVG